MELNEINWENLKQVLDLKVSKDQEQFIPSNAIFLAQAYVNLKYHYPDSCFALYEKDTLVGFTKIVYVPAHEKVYYFDHNVYMIDALMIDEKYQRKGLGKKALKEIIDFINLLPFGNYHSIVLLVNKENRIAEDFYGKFGFQKADHLVKGMNLLILEK